MHQLALYNNHNLGEEFFEELVDNGKPVYEIEHDANNLGSGWGSEYVYASPTGYFVYSETEWWLGPFDNLKEALEITELNFLTGALTSVVSTELSEEELKNILKSPLEEGFTFKLNKNTWRVNHSGRVEPLEQAL